MKVKRWIRTGELPEAGTTEELLEAAGGALDGACSWDICGQTVFEGEDGNVYVLNVEAVIGRASADYVKELEEEDHKKYGRHGAKEGKAFNVHTVHAVAVHHGHGTDIFTGGTEDEMWHKVADYCREWWDEAVEGMEGRKPKCPKDDREAIQKYFAIFENNGTETLDEPVATAVHIPG